MLFWWIDIIVQLNGYILFWCVLFFTKSVPILRCFNDQEKSLHKHKHKHKQNYVPFGLKLKHKSVA